VARPPQRAREQLLGEEGPPSSHLKIILAELWHCAVHEVDIHYTLEDMEEGIARLQVQSEIDDRNNWKAEQKRKTTTR
jgi:hypothetical protein